MVRFLLILGITSFMINGCKKDNQENFLENSDAKFNTLLAYDYAIDVPVNNPGVVIHIDSLSFFKSKSLQNDKSKETKNLISKIQELDKNFDVYQIVKDNTIKILNENNYNYTILDDFKKSDFPKEIISKHNFNKIINFDKLKENYKQDDLILINVKNGFDYNEEDKNKYVAKTYVYIYIINSKNKTLKFSESIAGTKYIDEANESLTSDYLAQIMKQSIENTMEIIDKKY